jgi:hypothetical protein
MDLGFKGENPKSHLIMNMDHNFSRYLQLRACVTHLLPSGSTCPHSRLFAPPSLPPTYLHHIPLTLPNPTTHPNLPTSLYHPLTHFRSPFPPHDPEYDCGQNPHQENYRHDVFRGSASGQSYDNRGRKAAGGRGKY